MNANIFAAAQLGTPRWARGLLRSSDMSKLAVLGVTLALTACGGESASSGGTGGAGVGGSAGAGGSGAQVGTGGTPAKGSLAWPAEKPSFVLSTTDQEPSYTGPAFGQVRLDLRQEAGGFSAAIGAQVACSVAVDSSAVTLSACGQQGNTTIEKVVLPRALDGALTGTFQAVSRYDGLLPRRHAGPRDD